MKKTVMVVDDHATLGDVLGQMLRVLGHRAEVFKSASDCLEWLRGETPDVAFLDLRMPGMDGIALLERIRERGHRFPVFAITGYPGDELAREAQDLGAVAVLSKPVSMDLLQGLQRESGMAMILITHDLGVVAEVADHVAVMYAGRVVERGKVREVLGKPAHPYTLALLESVPQLQQNSRALRPIVGSPPDMAAPPSGCAFHPRCRFATAECKVTLPAAVAVKTGRLAECHHAMKVFNGG